MIEDKTITKGSIMIYTRTPVKDLYSSHLAYSVHLAYSIDGISYEALNQNYGILFASATVANNNTLKEKGLKKPYVFYTANGKFGIVAVRINADGSDDEESKGKVMLWTSEDLFHFKEIGLVDLQKDAYVQEVICEYDLLTGVYVISWKDAGGNFYKNTLSDMYDLGSVSGAEIGSSVSYTTAVTAPEGAVKGNVLKVDAKFGTELLIKWSPLENIDIKVPGLIKAASQDEVKAVTATAVYTDGSTAIKQVAWNTDKIDFLKPGTYEVTGTVTQDVYPFPLAVGYADPDVIEWNGKYYFIATNDNTNDIGLYVREADTVLGLFEKGVKEYLILDVNESKGLVQTFWAPEFHIIENELYILFAVSGNVWGPQSHVMKLKKNGNIMDSDDWEAPIRVMKMDGTYLATSGITLDMTYFEAWGISYLMWSYRIWSPEDSGSMLYIATINPDKPWQLTSEPVLLSRPLYGWENNEHTINNEGPYAIVTEDYVYITYSGGAAGGYTYVLGLLTINKGDNLLDSNNWIKNNAPVLSYYSVKGEYGPGHNTFFKDKYGNLMIAYHAQEAMRGTPRCTAIRRVHFNINGTPVFDMSAERDLNAEFTQVNTKVVVEGVSL
jgi:GH43 family beta-xylosidase